VLLVPRLLVAAATVTDTAYTDMPMPMTGLLRVVQQFESAGGVGAGVRHEELIRMAGCGILDVCTCRVMW
jgi:hypothetical protein